MPEPPENVNTQFTKKSGLNSIPGNINFLIDLLHKINKMIILQLTTLQGFKIQIWTKIENWKQPGLHFEFTINKDC